MKKFLKKLAKGEEKIDYNDLLFEIDDPVIKNYDFLENLGMLYDLLINLLNEDETIFDAPAMQLDLTKIIYSLKSIIAKKFENIIDKSEKQKKEIFAAQNSVLIKFNELVNKIGDIINQITKKNIISKSKKFFEANEKITESVAEQSDRSISSWVKVWEERFNLIKQIINENKDLGTTINNKRYTLNDANDLVNKITKKKKIGKNKTINFYNNLVEKLKQIWKLRPTPPRQKMLELFSYLGKILMNLKQMNN